MGSKSKAPKPDPNIGLAQSQMADIARQQLEFSKEAYYAEQPRLDRYADLADEFVRLQSQAQQQQSQLTADYQQRMQGTFYPIEDTLAFDALGYYDAPPEQQAKIEQAYIAQNRGLVTQRFDDMQTQAQQDDLARRQSFEKQLAGLGEMVPGLRVSSTGADATTNPFARMIAAIRGDAPMAAQDVQLAGGGLRESLAQQQASIRDMETQLSRYKPDSAQYRALAARLSSAREGEAKLSAFQDSFADYLTVDPETGKTLAEKTQADRLGGLQTQRERELANVGSTLDTVRAYADTYKSGQEQQAGMARQDVANQFDQRQQQLQRQLQSFGVDPTSGRFAAQMNSNAILQAANEANAMNQARQAAKQLGWAKRMDAAGLGRGLPSNQAGSAQLAQQLGQGGLQGQASVSGLNQSANSALMAGLGASGSSWGNLGQLGLANTQMQQQAYQQGQAGQGALLGAVAGAAGTIFGGPIGGALASSLTSQVAGGK